MVASAVLMVRASLNWQWQFVRNCQFAVYIDCMFTDMYMYIVLYILQGQYSSAFKIASSIRDWLVLVFTLLDVFFFFGVLLNMVLFSSLEFLDLCCRSEARESVAKRRKSFKISNAQVLWGYEKSIILLSV